MGAGALVKQAEKVEEDNPSLWWDPYFEWEADAMALAYARWAVEKPEECNKMAWFDLFNEYSLIGVGGHYLSLPFAEFDRLSRYAKSRNGLTAPPRLALTLMALLGTGTPKTKADVLFEMHAVEGTIEGVVQPTVTKASIRPLMECLVQALDVLGLSKKKHVTDELKSAPSSPRLDVDDIIAGCFRGDDPLDKDGFWLMWRWRSKQNLIFGAILDEELGHPHPPRGAKKRKHPLLRKKQSASRLDPARSKKRQDRVRAKFSVDAASAVRGEEYAKEADQRKKNTGTFIASASARKVDFDNHMRRVNRVASQKVMQELMDSTGMTYQDLSALRQEFAYSLSNMHAVDAVDPETGKTVRAELGAMMSVERLKNVLLARFPALQDGRLLKRICQVFDADGNEHVDFVEFASTLSRLVSTRKNAAGEDSNILEFVFSLFDRDGNGQIELWEICELVETAHDDLVDLYTYAVEKSGSLDLNGDGKISCQEFVESIEADEVYRDLLWSTLPPVPASVTSARLAPVARAIRQSVGIETDGEGDLEKEKLIVEKFMELREHMLLYTKSGELFLMDIEKFWHEVVKTFGETLAPLHDDAFEVLKYFAVRGEKASTHGSERHVAEDSHHYQVHGRNCWAVLARSCAGKDTRFKAQLLASLVNDNTEAHGAGFVTREEIERFLRVMKKNADDLSKNAVSMLDDLDENGDGVLELSELKAVVFDNPAVLHCMSMLHMYNGDLSHARGRVVEERGSPRRPPGEAIWFWDCSPRRPPGEAIWFWDCSPRIPPGKATHTPQAPGQGKYHEERYGAASPPKLAAKEPVTE